ncbi:MAG TPA: DUF1648 domain-containing protein, partial [Catenuloplanes sp.]
MSENTSAPWRTVVAVASAWLPAVVVAATAAAWWDRLPTRLANHWSGPGEPDGFSSTSAAWWWSFAIAVLAGLVAVAAAVAQRRSPAARGLFALAGAAGGVAAAGWFVSARATLAADTPETARLGWHAAWFLLGMAWIAVPYLVNGHRGTNAAPGPAASVGMALAPQERAVWTVTLRSPLIIVTTLATTAVTVALVPVAGWWLLLVAAVPVLAMLAFGSVRVSADRRGLRLVANLLRVPIKTIPLARIEAATAEDIDPMAWGGWGYRVLPGRSALVLRAGPGLVLRL